jgi:hypothetical protein
MVTSPDLIGSEAARRLYGHDFLKVQIDHGLKGFARGGITRGLRQCFQPARILVA